MQTYESRSEMPPRMAALVAQMMVSHAARELAAVELFEHGLQFAPDSKRAKFLAWHMGEEREHYAAVFKMHLAFAGESLEGRVRQRLVDRPIPSVDSWFELAMAQFLYDRGGYWQLRELEQCAFLPYREVVRRIVEDEAGHQQAGEAMVVELCASGRYDAVKQACFERWLREGLLSFGRPGTEAGRLACEWGLKKRDSGEVMVDFVDDIRPAMRACGLEFPLQERLGLELPAFINFSVR